MEDIERLGRAIKQVQWRHHRALDSRLRALGTTLAQWDALRAIANAPAASATSSALATFQSDQAFGTLANRLEAQHLIVRTPGHGRRIEHRLTPAGETLLEQGRGTALQVFTRVIRRPERRRARAAPRPTRARQARLGPRLRRERGARAARAGAGRGRRGRGARGRGRRAGRGARGAARGARGARRGRAGRGARGAAAPSCVVRGARRGRYGEQTVGPRVKSRNVARRLVAHGAT